MKIEQVLNGKILSDEPAPKHNRLWYETTSGFVPPDGYYFQSDCGKYRYGPFDTWEQSFRGYSDWEFGEEYP